MEKGDGVPSAVKPEGLESYRSVSELAAYTNVSSRTIERWWKEGHIPETLKTNDGMKLWSPDAAQKVLEYRMLRLPSTRFSRRRITRT